jgi:metallophosphoesterase superfamily enzyme
MKGSNNIKFLDDCLLIEDTLVIGDVHIGYDSQFHGMAVFPNVQIENIIEKLEKVFENLESEKFKVRKVVLLGDVKHDFGGISDIEWRDTIRFLDYLKSKVGKIVVIKGNHDMVLSPILEKRGIKLKDYFKVKLKNGQRVWFMHGDKMFKQCLDDSTDRQLDRQTRGKKIAKVLKGGIGRVNGGENVEKEDINKDIFVFGHLHPAIVLNDEYKSEKYKCFLEGEWKGRRVFVLPSFSSASLGFDLSEVDKLNERERVSRSGRKIKGKFFVIDGKDLKKFRVVVYDNKENKEYRFGRLGDLIGLVS